MIYACATLGLHAFFSRGGGILPLQCDWSLSYDQALVNASYCDNDIWGVLLTDGRVGSDARGRGDHTNLPVVVGFRRLT